MKQQEFDFSDEDKDKLERAALLLQMQGTGFDAGPQKMYAVWSIRLKRWLSSGSGRTVWKRKGAAKNVAKYNGSSGYVIVEMQISPRAIVEMKNE